MSIDEKENDLPRPPSKDDVLIRPERSAWQMNACLNHAQNSDYGYRHGYRRAAFILAEWVNINGVDQDSLVFPIFHSYRHHVELMLKRLIETGCNLLGRGLTTHEMGLLKRHRLDKLWEAFGPILNEVSKSSHMEPPPKQELEGVESYIKQITDVDPESFSFRYSTSQVGAQSVPDVTHLNLLVFANYMERLCDYLDGIDGFFMYYKDSLDEIYSAGEY